MELKAQPGGDLVLGGAELAAAFMRHDLIDEYRAGVTGGGHQPGHTVSVALAVMRLTTSLNRVLIRPRLPTGNAGASPLLGDGETRSEDERRTGYLLDEWLSGHQVEETTRASLG